MTTYDYTMIGVTVGDDYVATVELQNGPVNFFDMRMIKELVDAFERLDEDKRCRAIVLAAEGKVFSAGANFGDGSNKDSSIAGVEKKSTKDESGFRSSSSLLYAEAVRLFKNKKPIIGAIEGSAIGGGLGLALVPDFRVSCVEAKFAANFSQLGIHPGFGLTHTLPALIGQQQAHRLFYTGKRINGEAAEKIGLIDTLVDRSEVRAEAHRQAVEIASAAPLAVMSVRETVRAGLGDRVETATRREGAEQAWLIETADAAEGMKAVSERRAGNFNQA
ncbi:MAG: enoyl-CoA hydratase/isomerase family protein [Pseudomonadales bacterium]|nr:enoyl-CoA hydratase/isomerase family protein [Pseudomonadales bacterium]